MKFLVDAQLPPALARAMASEGHDAVHVCDLDMTSASDPEVWNEGLRRGAAIHGPDDRGGGKDHRSSVTASPRG
ncbi:DUF5615 family PIN-like protein [Nocardia xishanensis]